MEKQQHENYVSVARALARLADMLEYACWDYPDDATQAKELVAEADRLLEKLKIKRD
jgi:hypothetical protein